MEIRSEGARAGLGALVASLTAIMLIVSPAEAQLVPVRVPSTGIQMVDSTAEAAQQAIADVVGGGAPAPTDPPTSKPPKPPMSVPGGGGSLSSGSTSPVASPSAGQKVDAAPTEAVQVPASAPNPEPAQGSTGSGPAAAKSAPTTRSGKRGKGPGGEPSNVGAKPSTAAESTGLQRIVQIIPTTVKVGLVALTLLLVMSIVLVMRSRLRLTQAERRAVTDALTGLPNRRHADEVVERLLAAARRNRRPLSVILLDVDRFKAVNDTFGHAAGDEVLKATATAARKLLRGADHVARFGGEEFIVILPETGQVDAALVAEKLRCRLAALKVPQLAGGFITASFGVAAFPDDGAGYDELLKSADEALYRAKEAGRNRVEPALLPVKADDVPAEAPALV